eukprot:CAMPEP_0172457638 /NCGR_PEP_ID=MMETSP1065-20121228/23204_1 /TAXON_ID=265537 /ORGANISM="Amphiprora paludosa, Strain CCMP125" /LENGTH=269 /DNA_ID=CAMNT_0013211487 /DNA_START=153 /DNA_END=962 /DNA_ORIENTATION=+
MKAWIDRYQKIVNGEIRVTDLSVRELKEYLDNSKELSNSKETHDDCFDKESLQKRVAESVLRHHKLYAALRNEFENLGDKDALRDANMQSQMDDPLVLAPAYLIAHIPWRPFCLNKEWIATENNLLLLVPTWEDDRVAAIFQTKYNGQKDPRIANEQRDFLLNALKGAGISQLKADPATETAQAIGTAAILLSYHGNHDEDFYDGTDVVRNFHPSQGIDIVTVWNQVPRNWEPSVAPGGKRKPESVLRAVDFLREKVGECKPIGSSSEE